MHNKKITLLLFLFLILQGCTNKECEETINQAYIYPENASGEQAIKLLKIPASTLRCLSTQALVQTCHNYPDFGVVRAFNNLQQGFNKVSSDCNGFDELWKRGDKFQELFSLYQQKNHDRGDWDSHTNLENGRYLFDIIYLELIISQYNILQHLSITEKIELLQLTIENQKKKIDLIKQWGVIGMETTIGILGRIMYLNNYMPLVQEYNSNKNMFLTVEYIFISDYDVVTKIMSLSEDYLKILKSEQ